MIRQAQLSLVRVAGGKFSRMLPRRINRRNPPSSALPRSETPSLSVGAPHRADSRNFIHSACIHCAGRCGCSRSNSLCRAAGGTFPPNFLVMSGLPNGIYAFRVIANNAQGNNGLSNPSNNVTLPTIVPPLIPTNVTATAGDTVAFVNFVAPPNAATAGDHRLPDHFKARGRREPSSCGYRYQRNRDWVDGWHHLYLLCPRNQCWR